MTPLLKRYHEQVTLLSRIGDIVLCAVAFFLAYLAKGSAWFHGRGGVAPLDDYLWILSASLFLHFQLYPYFGFYESLRRKSLRQILSAVWGSALAEFFVLGGLVFILQAKETSRYFFVLFLFFNYALLLAERFAVRLLLSAIRQRGYNYRRVLVVGCGQNARRVIETLRRNKRWGYIVMGCVSESNGPAPAALSYEDVPVLGNMDSLSTVIRSQRVDEAIVAPDHLDVRGFFAAAGDCERLGIPVRLSLGFFDLRNSKITFNEMDGIPLVTFYTTLLTPVQAAYKRSVDVVFGLMGGIFTLLLFPWIAYRIRKDGPGPVIFRQARVGQNGRSFKCYKFRTMYVDAEARRAELEVQNEMNGPLFKVKEDPRVTPFGKFLRRTSLDELPQFLNILRGEMSLVGTRPPTLDEVRKYSLDDRRRLSIRPGLTGLWQVSGRNQIQKFDDVLALDLRYIDNWSIKLDLWIILRTFGVLFFRKGAY